jgi:hypothetical protein
MEIMVEIMPVSDAFRPERERLCSRFAVRPVLFNYYL